MTLKTDKDRDIFRFDNSGGTRQNSRVVLHIARITFVLYSLLITAISLYSGHDENSITDLDRYEIEHLDKMLHFAVYTIYAFIGIGITSRLKQYIRLCIAIALYGLFMEYLQGALIPEREASFSDALANTVGVLCGGFFAIKLHNK